MPLPDGTVLEDRYEVLRSLRSGGMGAVYEGRDRRLANTPCAIKEIREDRLNSSDAQWLTARFRSEMEALARLDHPGIPRVRDYFQHGGAFFIVMDYVDGRSLDQELAETLSVTGRPPQNEVVVADIIQILEILTYLHGQEPPIIHRDIKPSNLIREERSGRIKLVDFGLAKSLEGATSHTMVGTPGFCSLEQMKGRAEPRSDLYSVGVTMHHMLSGRPPRILEVDPLTECMPDYQSGLAAIVERATAQEPKDRFADADSMLTALRLWLKAAMNPVPVGIGPPPVARATPQPAQPAPPAPIPIPIPSPSAGPPPPPQPHPFERRPQSYQLAAESTRTLPSSRGYLGALALAGLISLGFVMGKVAAPAAPQPTGSPVATASIAAEMAASVPQSPERQTTPKTSHAPTSQPKTVAGRPKPRPLATQPPPRPVVSPRSANRPALGGQAYPTARNRPRALGGPGYPQAGQASTALAPTNLQAAAPARPAGLTQIEPEAIGFGMARLSPAINRGYAWMPGHTRTFKAKDSDYYIQVLGWRYSGAMPEAMDYCRNHAPDLLGQTWFAGGGVSGCETQRGRELCITSQSGDAYGGLHLKFRQLPDGSTGVLGLVLKSHQGWDEAGRRAAEVVPYFNYD